MASIKRIGVLTGGGDCSGLNAAIRAVTKTAIKSGYEVIGMRDGWQGIVDGHYEVLDSEKTSQIINLGGTILGTSRFSPLKVEGGPKKVMDRMKELGLEALVVLGGEGTLSVSAKLSRMGVPVVGIPKTIDNDVEGTDYAIGFQTAVQIATDALDRLRSTAESHHRVMLLEVMGRNTGWIATYAGLAGGADAILIPEIPLDDRGIDELCQMVQRRYIKGKSYSIIVVAEGARLVGGDGGGGAREAPASRKIGQDIKDIIEQKTGLETRFSSLDYIQRGGTPVAYDRSLATAFGVKAAEMVNKQKYGEMAALRGEKITSVGLEEVVDRVKGVNLRTYRVAQRFFG